MSARAFNVVFVAAIALVVAVQAQHQWRFPGADGRSVFAVHDFEAFYCAGATRDAGGDLYLASDYLACGGRRPGHAPVREKLDSPAPIPAYDVALFAIVARLPYTFAAYLWLALSTVAIFGGAIFFARAADLPPPLVAGTFAIIAETALYYGQLTPIALGALCLAAFAAQRGRMWLAGAAVVAATIEPHVGIPALLAAAI